MDSETFKQVFIPYHQKLYRVAFRLVQDCDTAQDIVQEAYIKLWNQKEKCEAIKNTEAYAVVIVRNLCLDHLNQLKKTKHINEPLLVETSYQENYETQNEVAYIKKIVDQLPEQQRLVFWMKHWDGASNKEIEETLNLTAVNLRVLLSRARKSIKDQFLKLRYHENNTRY
jgi:RNA polymerase sigma-70 factor, ECF subfamily